MKLKFCGADQEVTGSCHLLTLVDGTKILLDCGLYQGSDEKMDHFNEKWLFEPSEIDILIVSHAHIDHTGRIPKLVADGFSGKIYATHATRDLCSIMLVDSAKIQEGDAAYHNKKKGFSAPEKKPLYTVEDTYKALDQFASFSYEQWFKVHDDVRVLYRDAGHILGSASVTLEINEGGRIIRLGFSGDIGRPDRPILKDPVPMPELDYLICESTYGDRLHESSPNEIDHLLKVVLHACVEKKGKLIIPAFSVGRTQEIVFMLDQLHNEGRLPKIAVYVDSPLAVNATDIFVSHPECFDKELNDYMQTDDNPFGFNGLTYVRSVEGSKALNNMHSPAIIISASGMMTGGRIKHHLLNNIDNPHSTFLLVGYAPPDTPAGMLRDGARSLYVLGQNKQVLAEIDEMDSFSAHGDQHEMYEFIKNQAAGLKKLWLVHGTIDRQTIWRDFLLQKGFKSIDIPTLGEEVEI